MKSKHFKSESDVFQVAIQLLVVTTEEIYMGTQEIFAKGLSSERLHNKCL